MRLKKTFREDGLEPRAKAKASCALRPVDGGDYDGHWKNDKMDGTSIFTWSDGRKYLDERKDGRRLAVAGGSGGVGGG